MMKYLLGAFCTIIVLYAAIHVRIAFRLLNNLSQEIQEKRYRRSQLPSRGQQLRNQRMSQAAALKKSSLSQITHTTTTSSGGQRRRALIISVAPRTTKHVVALWSELECFTLDVDYVVLSGPTWSETILNQVLSLAKSSIPRFSSGKVGLEGRVFVNDRYDVGLWCDALDWLESKNDDNHLPSFEQVGLLNDSVFALRAYTELFEALDDYNVSLASLSYSLNRPEGYGPQHYWVESVWRAFDRPGLDVFRSYSCRPANDPMFCSRKWWGKKGCIVENFERNMARQFPQEQVLGLFSSDVPNDMLTRRYNFKTWVRHPPYWKKLVEEQAFPVSKVNWKEMIDSIDDERLRTCTQYLDRSGLDRFDFSAAVTAL
mmetsp:Transcript_17175/g.29914  ORF Transcript_17175/g.29914 Transcript_17175/m.29914 type:complete len:372 (+) Transcript_17175:43-1158(+)